jgi:hypothetical protein
MEAIVGSRWNNANLWSLFGIGVAITTQSIGRQQLQTVTVCKTSRSLTRYRSAFARKEPDPPQVMRLSWSQHLAAARSVELTGRDQTGTALALMGMALLILLQDLQPSSLLDASDTDSEIPASER